jgi:two-component system OmpR family sensor kinase
MGRLFWKIFLGFWLSLVVISVAIGIAVNLYNQARFEERDELAAGPRTELVINAVATSLQYGGREAVEALFADWPRNYRSPVLIVDAQGQDLFNRNVPAAVLERARQDIGAAVRAPGLRRVRMAGGDEYLVFMPGDPHRDRGQRHRPPDRSPFMTLLITAALTGLLFSASLAWYLARPVRHLREASRQLAAGHLDTRVASRIGRRRDEIADLGRDFDHMAGQLQASMNAQQRLLHDVSHELRSPLARMQVAIGLLQQNPDNAEHTLARIQRESGRLDELVGQLLTLSRLEAGIGLPSEQIDLTQLLHDIVADARFESAADARNVTLQAEDGLTLSGNHEALHRALDNIVRNALRYTPADSSVEIKAARNQSGGIHITVCDAGPGVAQDKLDVLFEPFVRGDDNAARNGYGLGLAIARRAVEAHGGRILALNRQEGGLCIVVELKAGSAYADK